MRRALITGVEGQDGYYLSKLLVDSGYEVHGFVREDDSHTVDNRITVHTVDLTDGNRLGELIRTIAPDEVYNLAAVSSVAASWNDPVETTMTNALAVSVILSAVSDVQRLRDAPVRFVQASSAEIFGQANEAPQNEQTPIRPVSPYGASKAFAHQMVGIFRSRGIFASSCILYNHESPRRPTNFVTRKITQSVARISRGLQETLTLGNLDSRRDWGWAPDFASALHLAARAEHPDDFIIATGQSHSVQDFVSAAFLHVGIEDWRDLVRVSDEFSRPVDPTLQVGDARRAREVLGWEPSVSFDSLVGAMVDYDLMLLDSE